MQLKADGYEFTVEETSDTFTIRLKDGDGNEKEYGFTKVNLGNVLFKDENKRLVSKPLQDVMEAKIRFPDLGGLEGVKKMEEQKKLKQNEKNG